MTTQPSTSAVLPVRNTLASSMQSPPASAEATRVTSLSPGFARPGAPPRSTCLFTSSPSPRRMASRLAGEQQPGNWPPGGDRRRRRGCGRGVQVVASIGCSLSPAWFSVQKPLSQIQRSTLTPFQQTFNSHAFGGFGLNLTPLWRLRSLWLNWGNKGGKAMKAVRAHVVGGPDVLKYEDVPEPTPGPGEALVDIKSIGVNYSRRLQSQGDQSPGSLPLDARTRGRRGGHLCRRRRDRGHGGRPGGLRHAHRLLSPSGMWCRLGCWCASQMKWTSLPRQPPCFKA